MRDLVVCSYRGYENHFSNFENLEVDVVDQDQEDASIHQNNSNEVLRLKSKSINLKLTGEWINTTFLRSISDHMQLVKSLYITCDFLRDGDGVVHFPNLEYLTLNVNYLPKNLPFSCDKLNALTIKKDHFYSDIQFKTFISQYRSSLRKLIIRTNDYIRELEIVNEALMVTEEVPTSPLHRLA